MSVKVFSQEEWQKLFNTFMQSSMQVIDDSILFYYANTLKNNPAHRKLDEYSLTELAKGHKIATLIRRSIVANRQAYAIQYGTTEFNEIELKDPNVNDIFKRRELFLVLSSLIYNCVDNSGYCTLPDDVKKILKDVQISCALHIFTYGED